MIYAFRLAKRELRGGVRGFGVFLACLVLGVGAVAAIGSLRAAVEAGLRADARLLLGGDVSARLALRPADDAEREFLAGSGALSETASLRAMARSLDGERRSLIELRAVDAAYPLYGAIVLSPAGPLGTALAQDDGVLGAVMEPAAATRLGVRPGEKFRLGDGTFRLTALVQRLPDAALGGLSFGPRVIIARSALAATGLLRPGALVTYEYRIRLPQGGDAAAWIEQARAAFPQAGWRLRDSTDASPSLERLLDRLGFFLNLAGITALLVGGIGVGNAVTGYIASKTDAIATLKCLGASTRLVFAAYLLQILVLALIGIAIGLALGTTAPLLAGPLLSGLLPVSLPIGAYWAPLGFAALSGLLATLVFSLWPLAAIGRIPAGALWRDLLSPAPRRLAPLAAATTAIAARCSRAPSCGARRSPASPCGMSAVPSPPSRCSALPPGWLPPPRGTRRGPAIRCPAGARQSAPSGGAAARIVVSLGIGLSVMIAVALVQGNLAAEIGERLAEGAPADFYIDIQPDQLAGFERIVAAAPAPVRRGADAARSHHRLNGTPVEQAPVARMRNGRCATSAV